ncbi:MULTISPECIES: isocitrate lyase/phosphoenolpyruvate mutase family protein [unclassified Chryseobacterium]|uniref:isocitrate lyase/PEP mutase family protein n=1 Tax=unclassified Chryseobacterium TaxID=2593645 RepID=UPI00100A9B57|nr:MULTISPECIES: isocitrate lyase/phosphoenolpyruvate mutase family protein [unclassified Chryseobacterium]RXM53341.1 carboxyvinyl-carboxyphosphonate phosphorylmutase [Chryseobacterium sp. CH25]RXM65457.1 carboxyvinyl-carboxyphosphonate phosphorylmutase [Chryseobacterium sp. CH1]
MISFKKLHQEEEPLLLGNVWNVQSAKVYEKLGYKALATSSSAIAMSLGYEDGEQMSFEEYFYIIKRIKASVSIPLSVDLEGGYGNTPEIVVSNIIKLLEIGVAGINIEDTYVIEGERQLLDREFFFEKLSDILTMLKEKRSEIFINIRTDPFLLGMENALEETLERIKLFEKLDVDGIFVPGMIDVEDIKTVVKATSLPVNVMCLPDLPDFETLQSSGVKRITSGAFLNRHIYSELERISDTITNNKSFTALFI